MSKIDVTRIPRHPETLTPSPPPPPRPPPPPLPLPAPAPRPPPPRPPPSARVIKRFASRQRLGLTQTS
ncbi:hypothetical protein B5D80_23140 [Micromonospora wenchangensis]|uniref:Uncharacterized protein n=1 Tax=Micromonospora wenchangensis TaxID=1185415 RepID=A0A246RH35_9ACTN|nr:hypothetical protein B5D80_23140 [Micromonospora wenchangensis]